MNDKKHIHLPAGIPGNSVSWWGYTLKDPSLGSAPGAGTYSVDGSEPKAFKIPGLPSSSSPSQTNEEFFNTGTLSDGQHRVEVVYQGSPGDAPLVLDYILLQGDTTASSSSPPGMQVLTLSSPEQSSIPSSPLGTQVSTLSPPAQSSILSQKPTHGSHHINIGIVAGTTIGGLCILISLMFCFLHYRRRRRRFPVESIIEPFARNPNSNGSSPSSYEPQKSGNITSDSNPSMSLVVLDPTAMSKQQLAHLEVLRRAKVTYSVSDSQQRLLPQINTAEASGSSQRNNRVHDEPPNYYL